MTRSSPLEDFMVLAGRRLQAEADAAVRPTEPTEPTESTDWNALARAIAFIAESREGRVEALTPAFGSKTVK
ncbi:hypothetical protein [Streptomyces sp. NRRL B-3648]|uniref:hypothetical protein n=1 Tax=Streptomyces sp. NRRL B-3648 TaxID=1519493 RepID=UPI0006ADC0A4|nr:hypothetical protein [Streptomyces sp. NRRL B-3648]KOX03450.1 hypothetical protein ADL04_09675 [Streptomyces sp. NRRL B-3648]